MLYLTELQFKRFSVFFFFYFWVWKLRLIENNSFYHWILSNDSSNFLTNFHPQKEAYVSMWNLIKSVSWTSFTDGEMKATTTMKYCLWVRERKMFKLVQKKLWFSACIFWYSFVANFMIEVPENERRVCKTWVKEKEMKRKWDRSSKIKLESEWAAA